MATQIIAPREGEDTSCVLESWKCKKGDKVQLGDELGTVETGKARMDILSPEAGTVLALLYSEGDEIPISAPVAIIGNENEDISALLVKKAEAVHRDEDESKLTAPQKKRVDIFGENVKSTPKAKRIARKKGIPLNANLSESESDDQKRTERVTDPK